MEKTLIVYYSRTGNTRKVAEALQKELGCDIEEIQSVKSYAGPIGWILAGKEGSKRTNAKIKPAVKNPADYDLVILGTPIWAWNISSPVRAYLAMNKDNIKKIAAFCTMGGDLRNSFEEIEKECGRTLEAKMAITEKEIASGEFQNKIKNFL